MSLKFNEPFSRKWLFKETGPRKHGTLAAMVAYAGVLARNWLLLTRRSVEKSRVSRLRK